MPHHLRHNFATEIFENNDIEAARELLGHSDIGQTGGYLQTNENRLKDAMRRSDGFELRSELVVIYKAVRRGKLTARKFIERIKKLTYMKRESELCRKVKNFDLITRLL